MLGKLLCKIGLHDENKFDAREGQPEDFRAGYEPGAMVIFSVCSRCGTPEAHERKRRREMAREVP